MTYDKKMHIAQQVENFMNSFAQGDSGSLDRCLSNLKEIIDSDILEEGILMADRTKKQELDKLWVKAREAIKTASENDDKGKVFIDIQEIQKDLSESLNLLEMDYWETIRRYIIENLDKL